MADTRDCEEFRCSCKSIKLRACIDDSFMNVNSMSQTKLFVGQLVLNCRRSFRVFAVRVISAFPVNSSEVRTTSDSAAVVSNSSLGNSPWITWGKLMTLICSSSSEMRRNFDSSTSVKLVLCATVFERHLQHGICLILLVNLTGLNNCLKLDQPLSLTDVSRRLSSVEIRKRCLLLTGGLLVPRQFCSVTIAREFCLLRFGAFLLVLLSTRGNLFILCHSIHQPSSCAAILHLL